MQMRKVAAIAAVPMTVVASSVHAAVPAALTTMFGDLTTDAGTVFGLVVTLAVAAFAGLWLLGYAKKGARRAS